MPQTPPTLARYPRKRATHVAHASTPPTLARHPRYSRSRTTHAKHVLHTTHPSTPPMLARIADHFSNWMKTRSQESFISNQDTLTSLKVTHQQTVSLKSRWKQCNIDSRLRLTGRNTKLFHARYNIYLRSLICSHIVKRTIIRVCFVPFHYLFVLHST